MRRARGKFLPEIPLDLRTAHDMLILNSHVHKTLDGEGWLYAGKCGSSKHKDHCLIFISKTMKEGLAQATKIFADGTEDGTPSLMGCKQIYSITTTWDSQVRVGNIWNNCLKELNSVLTNLITNTVCFADNSSVYCYDAKENPAHIHKASAFTETAGAHIQSVNYTL